jgi:hypothetical protein
MSKTIAAILVLVMSCITYALASEGPLDGHRYTIDFVANKDDPVDRPAGSDSLIFTAGTAECAKAGKAYGYAPGTYKATAKKGLVTFTFTVVSAKHGQVTFAGQIAGKDIKGTRTWSKPGKANIVHTFAGKLE